LLLWNIQDKILAAAKFLKGRLAKAPAHKQPLHTQVTLLSDALRCSQMLSDALRCSQMLSDALRCSQMLSDAV
jgi:hypothetical protein